LCKTFRLALSFLYGLNTGSNANSFLRRTPSWCANQSSAAWLA
jgi:hypothetical protein